MIQLKRRNPLASPAHVTAAHMSFDGLAGCPLYRFQSSVLKEHFASTSSWSAIHGRGTHKRLQAGAHTCGRGGERTLASAI